jgi:4-hydroxy-2-oxoheptanedioate aldolase
MSEGSVRERWKGRDLTVGYLCAVPNAFTAELVAQVGFDFLIIDQQHGLIGYAATVAMLQAVARTDVCALVRVRSHDPALIGAALDAGAAGIIVPLVDSAADARSAVTACRYPPEGRRSYGASRAALVNPGSCEKTNSDVLCFVMVETTTALDAVDEIAGSPGVDGVFVGWGDLALSMGLPPTMDHARIRSALQRVSEACRHHGVVTAIGASADRAARLIELGYTMISVGSDHLALRQAAAAALAQTRAAVKAGGPSGGEVH